MVFQNDLRYRYNNKRWMYYFIIGLLSALMTLGSCGNNKPNMIIEAGKSLPKNIDFNFIQESARTRKIPLRIESLDNTKIHELYERKFILVRPDGHVAWRGDEISQDFGKILDVIRGA